MSKLSKAVDKAIAAENKRAIADGYVPYVGGPKYPEGFPEHTEYATKLRAALAELKNSSLTL